MSIHSSKQTILSFEQNAAFHARLAQKQLDENRFLPAIRSYCRALESDPKNPEYKLGLASVYTDMCCYEKSNRILLRLARERADHANECYFGMGCNYLGEGYYEQARDSFLLYLQREPDGTYAEDAEEMLMMIEDEFEARLQEEEVSIAVAQRAEEGKRALDMGDSKRAIRFLKEAVEQAPKLTYVRNNLALAYFLDNQKEQALLETKRVLKDEPNNIHALCNLAIVLGQDQTSGPAAKALNRVEKQTSETPDEALKAALTLFEANRLDSARKFFDQALDFFPYDDRTLFFAGVCAYNAGAYERALELFDRMAQCEENGGVGGYYRALCKDAIAGRTTVKSLTLQRQVPVEEAVRRIKFLNSIAAGPKEEMLRAWNSDPQFREYMFWALNLFDSSLQDTVIELLGLVGDDVAEETLRDFLMRREGAKEQKNHIFAILKNMGAEEPYIAVMDGTLVEARLTRTTVADENFPREYAAVMELCAKRMHERGLDDLIESALSVWNRFIQRLRGALPPLQNKAAWAAAVEMIAARMDGLKPDPDEVCQAYRVSHTALVHSYRELKRILQRGKGEEQDGSDD
ncbi:MAG: tetratricopeptide repeat protein [Clostridia bacterium]|nr:tetratricopeptide repeat protein [Clostridia bacterium]